MLEPVVIGTAGHIDHGKTAVVARLTGINTDRLPEEQRRGISIDIGFAPLTLPSGRPAAIVDVPGHERFIRNMLAGSHGIDVVLLVVAADEGVMPQTTEHLDIVSLLGVCCGVVALTKADLVDREWLDLVREEVAAALAGTPLADAPLVAVSARTGDGMADLLAALDATAARVPPRDSGGLARLPIDRVFTVAGFGTVVTGTLVSGSVHRDDRLTIQPGDRPVRVRQLQVHGRPADGASAGQRVAVNLVGVEVTAVQRGQVLVPVGTLEPTRRLLARVQVLARVARDLVAAQQVHLHVGTAETLARILPLDGRPLLAGSSGLAEVRCRDPVLVAPGDRFILRTFSPVTTVAGGEVVDAHPQRLRREPATVTAAEELARSGLAGRLLAALARRSAAVTPAQLTRDVGVPAEAVAGLLEDAVAAATAVAAGDGYLATAVVAGWERAVQHYVGAFHEAHPWRLGVSREEVRSAALGRVDARTAAWFMDRLVASGALVARGDLVSLAGFVPQLDNAQRAAVAALLTRLEAAGWEGPAAGDVAADLSRQGLPGGEVVVHLVQAGLAVRGGDLLFAAAVARRAGRLVLAAMESQGPLSASQIRELLGTSRKYVMPLLEYLDSARITRRVGDLRVPGPQAAAATTPKT